MKIPPCWFCKSEEVKAYPVVTNEHSSWFSTFCSGCEARGPVRKTKEEAIQAWSDIHGLKERRRDDAKPKKSVWVSAVVAFREGRKHHDLSVLQEQGDTRADALAKGMVRMTLERPNLKKVFCEAMEVKL